jgi:hypothetical protein
VTLRRAAADPALGILRLPASFSQTAWPSFRAEIASAPVAPPHSASRALKKPGGNPSSLTDRGERRPRSATSQGKPSRRALHDDLGPRTPGPHSHAPARNHVRPRIGAGPPRPDSPSRPCRSPCKSRPSASQSGPRKPRASPVRFVIRPGDWLPTPSPPSRWCPGAPPPHRE